MAAFDFSAIGFLVLDILGRPTTELPPEGGATFIGTALSPERRPSVIGTLMGVFLLAVMRNGLLLVGWNFFWQQVGIGVLVFVVLGLSFGLKKRSE